ncbi:hypothetical protein P3T35_007337 [Kitasatospora sp. GP30]|uniref:tetratricopeptide repeat protein n=1 Tax=Kitasatospora sp. GP30 TaxID=3035084 RepID=UPI00118089E3|nr:tetratricopeptide repeat protein [Kitasatospora sp. GP30]MDH6145282.1 hypothetical protein [Kitasatospora sp. GP30]
MLHLGAARALTGQGRAQEALAAVEEAQDIFDRAPGPGQLAHDMSAIHMARAAALLALQRPAEAEHEARKCLSRCERHLGPAHHRALEAATVLGTALAGLHRTDGPPSSCMPPTTPGTPTSAPTTTALPEPARCWPPSSTIHTDTGPLPGWAPW